MPKTQPKSDLKVKLAAVVVMLIAAGAVVVYSLSGPHVGEALPNSGEGAGATPESPPTEQSTRGTQPTRPVQERKSGYVGNRVVPTDAPGGGGG